MFRLWHFKFMLNPLKTELTLKIEKLSDSVIYILPLPSKHNCIPLTFNAMYF